VYDCGSRERGGASKQKRKRAKMNVLNLHSLMNSRTREAQWELKRLNNMRPNQTKINQQLRDLSFDFFSVYAHISSFSFFLGSSRVRSLAHDSFWSARAFHFFPFSFEF
jgi:hypothetical protein